MTKAAGRAEIEELHRFLVGWLGGTLPRTEAAFAAFASVLAPDFAIVSPRGVVTERAALLGELEAAHGVHGGPGKAFAIRIENVVLRHDGDGLALFTYEEWQEIGGAAANARISTVLFARDAAAPNGLVWLHLHETWLPGHAPET